MVSHFYSHCKPFTVIYIHFLMVELELSMMNHPFLNPSGIPSMLFPWFFFPCQKCPHLAVLPVTPSSASLSYHVRRVERYGLQWQLLRGSPGGGFLEISRKVGGAFCWKIFEWIFDHGRLVVTGTSILCLHSVGNVIIPIDFHIFQRGRYTTSQISTDISDGTSLRLAQTRQL